MAKTKNQDMSKMSKEELHKKMKELNLELIKARVGSAKAGSSKIKQAKRSMAKILTLNKFDKEELKK